MNWNIQIPKKVAKNIGKLPASVKKTLFLLMREIEEDGPVRGNWTNFSKLEKDRFHCHLKKGHPTYVAVWEIYNKKIHLVEVIYVGTHEKAPY